MYTRQQYIHDECTHEQYYAQFVNDEVKNRVIKAFTLKKLLNSKDEHLNDLSMKVWGLLGGFVWQVVGGQEVAVIKPTRSSDILPVDYELLKEAGEGISCSTMVCIYKEAGKQIIRDYK